MQFRFRYRVRINGIKSLLLSFPFRSYFAVPLSLTLSFPLYAFFTLASLPILFPLAYPDGSTLHNFHLNRIISALPPREHVLTPSSEPTRSGNLITLQVAFPSSLAQNKVMLLKLNPSRSLLAILENGLAIQSLSLIERLLQCASPILVIEDTEMKEIILCWICTGLNYLRG